LTRINTEETIQNKIATNKPRIQLLMRGLAMVISLNLDLTQVHGDPLRRIERFEEIQRLVCISPKQWDMLNKIIRKNKVKF
jgi:hypothetical protein